MASFQNGVVPSSERMLSGIRATLSNISKRGVDDFSRNALAAIDVALNELLCRQQSAFYCAFYEKALAHVVEGLQMLSTLPAGAMGTEISQVLTALPSSLNPSEDFRSLYAHLNRLMRCLTEITDGMRGTASNEAGGYMARVTALEYELLARGQEFAGSAAARPTAASPRVLTRDSLETYMKTRFPKQHGLKLIGFRELTGGYQKTTILVDVELANGATESVVVRAEKDDRFVTIDAGDIRSEFEVVRLAHAAGVPVAEPLWIEPEASPLGQRFFVSRRVEGQNLGTAIATDATLKSSVVHDFVRVLAKIHSVPTDDAMKLSPIGRWLQYSSLRENTLANVDYWTGQRWARFANPSPILMRLKIWLEENVPVDDDDACFVHGDFGLHNVLVKDDAVSGVLDWEAARVGDPAEDLSWFLQSSGRKINSVEVLALYRELTGRHVSEYRLRYYDVFNAMKILVGAACAAGMHEMTPAAAIEWCNIPFIWAPLFASQVQTKIELAESSRAR